MSNPSDPSLSSQSHFQELISKDLGNAPLMVCLASLSKSEDLPNYERLGLSDDLSAQFRMLVMEELARHAKATQTHDLEVCDYHVGSTLGSHEIEHMDLDRHQPIQEQISSLQNPPALYECTYSEDFIAGLRFYVIAFQLPQEPPLICFRTYTPKKEIKRSPYFAALLNQNQLDRIREPLFLFDKHIDCLSQGKDLYIFNKRNFERIFKFFEMVAAAAEKTALEIVKLLPIANSQMFVEACKGSPIIGRKLADIATTGHLETLTVDDLKETITERNLSVSFVTIEGQEKLLYEPRYKWEFFKLLNDDYLVSLMTGKRYEATGKRPQK